MNTADEQQLISRINQLSSPLEPTPTGICARLNPLQNIRAILFDVYGTLFISGSGDISIASAMRNQDALANALQDAGFSGKLVEAGKQGCDLLLQAIQRTHATLREHGIACPEVDIREEWKDVLAILRQRHLIEGERSPEAIRRVSVEYEYRINPVWPMPDVISTLRALREQACVLGIVSNAQFYTLLMFPALLGTSLEDAGFIPELCAWSFQVREAKPSAHLFQGVRECLRNQYGIEPEHALYVGNDMLNDIWTASQNGLKTALFAGDQRSLRLRENDGRCADLQPDLILTTLPQLLAVLN